MLGRLENTVEAVVPVLRDMCGLVVQPDGMVFDPASVGGAVIKEGAEYAGVRVTFLGTLQNARVAMQVDIGFGDVVTPGPVPTDYPTLLALPAPHLNGYPRETVVAEKFEAMVKLGLVNSRMKDFYDLWVLARRFDFDGRTLVTAIERTFAHRNTAVAPLPIALTPAFADDPAKRSQWKGFVRRTRLDDAPGELAAVTGELRAFLVPVAEMVAAGTPFERSWKAPGPWA